MLTNEYYTKETGHFEMEFGDDESENICDDPIIERAVFERKCFSNLCNHFSSSPIAIHCSYRFSDVFV